MARSPSPAPWDEPGSSLSNVSSLEPGVSIAATEKGLRKKRIPPELSTSNATVPPSMARQGWFQNPAEEGVEVTPQSCKGWSFWSPVLPETSR
jgi:hypothetical protein